MLKIDNLSNEIDMTAVRGGSQDITMVGSGQMVFGGPGLTVAAQNNNQYASQYDSTYTSTAITTVFGQTNAGVWNWKA